MTVKTSLEISNDISKPEQLITEHIDIWTSAILAKSTSGRGSSKKYELYGISKLRELILELAVRGKLVPQDANDEPASGLLEKIAAEKAQLIKDKKVKKPKNLPKIEDNDVLFEAPSGWCWAYLQDISSYIQRGKGPSYAEDGKVMVVSQKCIQWKGFDLTPCRHISDDSLEKYQEERYLQNNDLLWNSTGTGTVGRINTIDHIEKNSLVADSHVTVIRPIKVHSIFLQTYISSPFIQKRIDPNFENPLVSGSTKQVELNTSVVLSLLTPVPPLAEQKRIVAKVDELMLLCDQLEQQTEASIDAHATLVEVLLATLTDSGNADELAQNWTRISEHFDSLFTTEQSIEALEQTVLQLAVMGKLVPQNPGDEPASVLLEKIAEEKEQLIKDKVIKKEKPSPAITDEEKPFKLQTGWVWGRINDIAHLKGGFAYKSKEFLDVGTYQVVRMGNIRPDNLRLDKNSVYIPEDLAESTQDYRINTGDILLTMTGTNGKEDYLYSLVVLDTHLLDQQLYLNQRLCRLRPILMNVDFLNIALKEPQLKKPIFNQSTGSANQANIGMGVISHWVLPVPPLAEQHRIVSKVDELMAICDQLKQKLKQSQETQVQLTDALIDRALE